MIEVINLSKKFRAKSALSDINVNLENENYGLVGPNGAGKTTFIRILAGLITPSSGKVICNSQKIGYLSQVFGCIPELTVLEQMEYFACLKKIPYESQRSKIMHALEKVNLSEQKNIKCKSLSGGMVRRLGIAQALLGSPELLLLDEPTVGLDPGERQSFSEIIGSLKGDMTVILSTHIISDIIKTCDKMLIMDQGKLIGTFDLDGCTENDIEELYFKALHHAEIK